MTKADVLAWVRGEVGEVRCPRCGAGVPASGWGRFRAWVDVIEVAVWCGRACAMGAKA